MENLSHLTAMTRSTLSRPAKILKMRNLIKGRVLDFGCGKGGDAKILGIEKYDPYYAPDFPEGKFDTVLCTYVLNTIGITEQSAVLIVLKNILSDSGIAYITVRRDIKKEGFTSKKTYQRNVVLDNPVLFENDQYCIYILAKDGK